jgi:hypothetical protein
MPVNWPFAGNEIRLGGIGRVRIQAEDADRQAVTVQEILADLAERPGILLSDEVGMGKTYIALAAAASVILATGGRQGPVVVMVPSRLLGKWQREWDQFKRHCAVPGTLDWIKDTYAHTPTEFFKLLDDDSRHRKHLVFITTGCFSQGFSDPWIKLAMIRMARSHTKLGTKQRQSIYRWAVQLVRMASYRRYLTEELVRRLMNTDVRRWKEVLVREEILDEEDDDPIPELLVKYEGQIDWGPLVDVLRNGLPKRASANLDERLKSSRHALVDACKAIYDQWLRRSKWHSPLLILDEAHHAKNDYTQLAQLFRASSSEDVTLLAGKFQRMLFLTATPFQLGHEELIRVLRSFEAVRWSGSRAPMVTREEFLAQINQLEASLDANRLAGRRLDRLWGQIRPEMLAGLDVETWWRRVESQPTDAWEERLVQAVQDCRKTREGAQQFLRPWLVRHNRPLGLPLENGGPPQPRRHSVCGRSILEDKDTEAVEEAGLPIGRQAVLPFLLTARAQGELAQRSGTRAFFAEGLASSYEAFHHTREARGKARDMTDDGRPMDGDGDEANAATTIVPTRWYEEQVARLIPSRSAPPEKRKEHPKIAATVQRVVDLWAGGEKSLVFCFYRETCKALYEHIRDEIEARTWAIAGDKLGDEYRGQPAKVQDYLTRITRRFSEEGRPFHEEIRQILSEPFGDPRYQILASYQKRLIEVLAAYFRSPSFLARYLPLGDPDVQRAWELGEGRREILEPGLVALRRGILEQTDQSNQTCMKRVHQFLDFAVELAERAQCQVCDSPEGDDEPENPLEECLRVVTVYSRPRTPDELDRDDLDDSSDDADGSYRAVPLVRIVHGDTKPEARERLALAFNSPLFPEVLVSSGVMGEGIDLHRFCRHVLHHDGYWNPSTLEQQTGRLDRIRCKAEVCRMPIKVYQPFLAGSADEKMFRVVRDRERWFQIVMGQKFEFDEGTSEVIVARVPLPEGLAKELTFDLARWRATKR